MYTFGVAHSLIHILIHSSVRWHGGWLVFIQELKIECNANFEETILITAGTGDDIDTILFPASCLKIPICQTQPNFQFKISK